MKCKAYIVIISLILFLSGCLSVKDKYLVENLSDTEKSDILTVKGIKMYEIQLDIKDDFRLIPEIRKLYKVALDFDPSNTTAQEYNQKLDDYIADTVNNYMEKINANMEKTEERTNDDDYILFFYIIKAYELDNDNEEVNELRKETRAILDELTAEYITEANTLTENALLETDQEAQEKILIDALALYTKISGVDHGNRQIDKESEAAKNQLIIIMQDKIVYLESKIADQYFSKSLPDIETLVKYDNMVNNELEPEITELQYFLYYEWAKYLYGIDSYDNANSKIRSAIYFAEKDEALELKSAISSKLADTREERTQEANEDSFADLITRIDNLIADGELAIAYNKIEDYEGSASGSSQRNALSERKSLIVGKLETIYQEGVTAYVDENFNTAINKFSIVVEIDSGYQDAAAYLERAKANQALLDSF